MDLKGLNSVYFTRQNLKIVLGDKRRTLDYRIRSLIRRGELERLKKGFYLNLDYYNRSPDQRLLLEYVGNVMVAPSYLSLETVLAQSGLLAESVFSLTYVTLKKTASFSTKPANFIYREIKEKLFFGYQRQVVDGLAYNVASLAKALFDLIYLTPLTSAGQRDEFCFNSRFNWEVLSVPVQAEFKQIVARSGIAKMAAIYRFLVKKGVMA